MANWVNIVPYYDDVRYGSWTNYKQRAGLSPGKYRAFSQGFRDMTLTMRVNRNGVEVHRHVITNDMSNTSNKLTEFMVTTANSYLDMYIESSGGVGGGGMYIERDADYVFSPVVGGGSSSVNIDGTWRTVTEQYVNIDGVWRTVSEQFVNIDGIWKNAFGSGKLTFSLSGMQGNQSTFVKDAAKGYMDLNCKDSSSPSATGTIMVAVTSNLKIDATGFTHLKIDWNAGESYLSGGRSHQAYFGSALFDSNTMGQTGSIGFSSRGTATLNVSGQGQQNLMIRTNRHQDMGAGGGSYANLKVYNIWLDDLLIWTGTNP